MPSTLLRCAVFFLACLGPLAVRAENWPQWRGPQGDGVSQEAELPLSWDESTGIAWKCKLPEWGCSTPAIWGDAVLVTSHLEDRELVLLRINRQTGKIEWQRTVGTGSAGRQSLYQKTGQQRRHQKFHDDQNLASPSPTTDGKTIIVHFGNGDLAAYDFAGNQLWRRNLQADYGDYTIWWGHANSPVLYENLVLSVCMQDSCKDLEGQPAPSYVVAHDKQTGQEVWKTPRVTEATAESCDSYTTPIFRRRGERLEMIVMGGQMLDAYDPADGRRLWYLPLVGNRTITGPVAAGDMIYVTQGMRQPLLGVRPGAAGQRTRRDIVWQVEQATPDSPTPVVRGDWLFLINNEGIARCLNARNGKQAWKERLKGQYRASPLAAAGRVYFLNTTGGCTVVAATSRFDRLTENQLDDRTLASPAASDGKLFIRGRKTLYCIGK
ncbi:MAG: PQQ-binding-like beta-propeller repeat protein [Thermoguttaceae bacterium]|jgi:outer membrane protein assembly factor BamB